MSIEDKAYNAVVARCNDIVKEDGLSAREFCICDETLALRCVCELSGSQELVPILSQRGASKLHYWMSVPPDTACHECMTRHEALELFMTTLEDDNVHAIGLGIEKIPFSDVHHFMSKNDTLESLAIEYDMKV